MAVAAVLSGGGGKHRRRGGDRRPGGNRYKQRWLMPYLWRRVSCDGRRSGGGGDGNGHGYRQWAGIPCGVVSRATIKVALFAIYFF